MQRSGSQKFLLVISIITIVFAALGILASLMAIVGGAAVNAVDSQEAASMLEGTGITQGEAGFAIVALSLVALIACVVDLVVGILGVRAANDNQKIMPVWVLAIVAIVVDVIALISTLVSGGDMSGIGSIVLQIAVSVLLFWVANNIKKQAGR